MGDETLLGESNNEEVITEDNSNTEEIPSIYGETEVQWPEGTEDTLKNDPVLKAFVNKEGKVETANLLKSYAHAKKSYGREKTVLPTDKSTDEEVNEFYNKLYGYESEFENYKINAKEGDDAILSKEATDEIRKFAHDNRMSPKMAQNLYNYTEEKVKADQENQLVQTETNREEGITALKEKWGGAYEGRINGAKQLIADYIKDDENLYGAFSTDPNIGSNPFIMEVLGTISAKLYKEGKLQSNDASGMTPDDVEKTIGEIMGDDSHPYKDANHPNHAAAQKEMLQLFEKRAKYRN